MNRHFDDHEEERRYNHRFGDEFQDPGPEVERVQDCVARTVRDGMQANGDLYRGGVLLDHRRGPHNAHPDRTADQGCSVRGMVELDSVTPDGYPTCDFCHESGMHDIWAEKPMRKMHMVDPGGEELIVCEWCIPKLNATALADSGEQRMVENGGSE